MAEAVGVFDFLEVRFDHLADQLVKSYGGPPAKPLVCLTRGADKGIHFRGAKITRIDLDQDLAALCIDAHLIEALPPPDDCPRDMRKGTFDEFAYRVGF